MKNDYCDGHNNLDKYKDGTINRSPSFMDAIYLNLHRFESFVCFDHHTAEVKKLKSTKKSL